MSKSMRLWHPDSPGVKVVVRVPWWRQASARKWHFASSREVRIMYKHMHLQGVEEIV